MALRDELLRANCLHAGRFAKGHLPPEPRRAFAVVTCMDARLDPARILGLQDGDANVLRNAGAIVTEDVLRSLAISRWLLGTRQAFVIGHVDCGMTRFTNGELRARLRDEAGVDASEIDFLPFGDVDESVREGVRRIRGSPLLGDAFAAGGFVYDVRTGRLTEVP